MRIMCPHCGAHLPSFSELLDSPEEDVVTCETCRTIVSREALAERLARSYRETERPPRERNMSGTFQVVPAHSRRLRSA